MPEYRAPAAAMPMVGIPACVKFIDPHPFHAVGEKYITAVAEGAGAVPVLIPALGETYDLDDLIGRLDGLLVTGSSSNVEPHHYGGPPSRPGTLHDKQRDATTLPLLRRAIALGCPLLAICRGLQELNVAFAGSLHQDVHHVAGMIDHRAPSTAPLEAAYGPAHALNLVPGGVLARLFASREIQVNSLHSQGIDRLGAGLVVEARAPDGLIEAVRVADAPAFALGLQWHPEWRFHDDLNSRALFTAFGDACRARAEQRRNRAERHGKVA
jgi:putative glutamine amidotransferase